MDAEFLSHVVAAFQNSTSELALSRSPLAHGLLVEPGLVLDDQHPAPDAIGEALRFSLMWAVEQLAPSPPAYPFGVERPMDDATLRDPAWTQYNLLRHRYLEPFHPRDFVESELYAETLIALLGLPSHLAYFDARERGMMAAAGWLLQQRDEGVGSARIREMALDAIEASLEDQPAARAMLGIASVFRGVFPVRTLHALAVEENVRYPERAIETLVTRGLLVAGDGATSLWISAALSEHAAQDQPLDRRLRRHWLAARLAREEGRPVASVDHLVQAGQWQAAAQALLTMGASQRVEHEAQLLELLGRVQLDDLDPDQRAGLRLMAAALCQQQGRMEEAIEACRLALEDARDRAVQADAYRQLGKLLERDNPAESLACLKHALERLAPESVWRTRVLIDMAWAALDAREWSEAEALLDRAAAEIAPGDDALAAEILDARSGVQRGMDHFAQAVESEERALALYEQGGDQMLVGKAYNTLGILRRLAADYAGAIEAYGRALAIFEGQGSRSLEATTLLNLGTAYHFDDRLDDAERCYRRCLALADAIGMPLTEVRAHANLCEALMQHGNEIEARGHWRHAYHLSVSSNYDGEVAFLLDLCERYPSLRAELETAQEDVPSGTGSAAVNRAVEPWRSAPISLGIHDGVESAALAIAQETGQVRASVLMERAQISKATATRKLTRLQESGLLVRHGQGRSTYYTPSASVPASLVSGDLGALQPRLDALAARLHNRFGVASLRAQSVMQIAGENGAIEAGYEVVAEFTGAPDLATFLAVERELGRATGAHVRLRLAEREP